LAQTLEKKSAAVFLYAIIERLPDLQWWDWPKEKISANINLLTRNIASELI